MDATSWNPVAAGRGQKGGQEGQEAGGEKRGEEREASGGRSYYPIDYSLHLIACTFAGSCSKLAIFCLNSANCYDDS